MTTGDVAGTVTDASGAVVPGASVTIKSLADDDTRTVVTSDAGQYRFSLLKPGEYTISAQTAGLKSNLPAPGATLVGWEGSTLVMSDAAASKARWEGAKLVAPGGESGAGGCFRERPRS